MSAIDPSAVFKRFVTDCSKGTSAVFISRGAMLTVNSDFNIKTMAEAIKFISDGGIETPTHLKTKPWENNPKPENIVPVYSWAFYSGDDYGYLAFFKVDEASKWTIKSFKKNLNPDPRKPGLPNLALKDLGQLWEKLQGEDHE